MIDRIIATIFFMIIWAYAITHWLLYIMTQTQLGGFIAFSVGVIIPAGVAGWIVQYILVKNR